MKRKNEDLNEDSNQSNKKISFRNEMELMSDTKLVMFSGGTASNGLCSKIRVWTENVHYVIPISDDGGSSFEIIRVLNGPSIGDIRSRLIRLSESHTTEARAVQELLAFRLNSDSEEARKRWYSIVEGRDPLWRSISEPYQETIRAFLVYFHNEVLKRAGNTKFDFSHGSVGNFFFTGARLFFNSLETAIFWFSRVASIPTETKVIPVINSNYRCTIAAELNNGKKIIGQNQISHPSANALQVVKTQTPKLTTTTNANQQQQQHHHHDDLLESPIKRIYYVNEDQQENQPIVNPNVVQSIQTQSHVIYSIGSLFTSIVPSLILRGVGEEIAKKSPNQFLKILMLNGTIDRETSCMKASDCIEAITAALNRYGELKNKSNSYVTHLIYPDLGVFNKQQHLSIEVDLVKIEKELGIKCVAVSAHIPESHPHSVHYNDDALSNQLKHLMQKFKSNAHEM